MNSTATTAETDPINIISLVGIAASLVINIWQTLMMKKITLASECCKTCFIELSEDGR